MYNDRTNLSEKQTKLGLLIYTDFLRDLNVSLRHYFFCFSGKKKIISDDKKIFCDVTFFSSPQQWKKISGNYIKREKRRT